MTDLLAVSLHELTIQILAWGSLLLGAVVILFGGVWYYRHRWLRSDDRGSGEPWTLDDLARMKQAGQISDEEYRVLRESIVAAFRGEHGSQGRSGRRNSADSPPPSREGEEPPGNRF